MKWFNIVDPHIPPDWVASFDVECGLIIQPKIFTSIPYFWCDYHDKEPAAIKIFEKYKAALLK